jgi:hypothetical protein
MGMTILSLAFTGGCGERANTPKEVTRAEMRGDTLLVTFPLELREKWEWGRPQEGGMTFDSTLQTYRLPPPEYQFSMGFTFADGNREISVDFPSDGTSDSNRSNPGIGSVGPASGAGSLAQLLATFGLPHAQFRQKDPEGTIPLTNVTLSALDDSVVVLMIIENGLGEYVKEEAGRPMKISGAYDFGRKTLFVQAALKVSGQAEKPVSAASEAVQLSDWPAPMPPDPSVFWQGDWANEVGDELAVRSTTMWMKYNSPDKTEHACKGSYGGVPSRQHEFDMRVRWRCDDGQDSLVVMSFRIDRWKTMAPRPGVFLQRVPVF